VAAPTSPSPGSADPSPAGAPGRDWAAQTADSIDRLVGTVRSKTSQPVERLTRIVVYGVLCVLLGATALVMLVIAAVRALDELIPGEVWPAHLIVGGIFVVGGLLVWRKRTASAR
jgi:hypothetical protein